MLKRRLRQRYRRRYRCRHGMVVTMARKIHERNIRKITKSGNGSYYVTLPIDFVRSLGWRERQKIVFEKRGETITIKDWKK